MLLVLRNLFPAGGVALLPNDAGPQFVDYHGDLQLVLRGLSA